MCRRNNVLLLLFSVLLLVSCKSGKTVVGSGNATLPPAGRQLEAVIANTPVFDAFSSRLRLTIPLKRGDYTLNGTLKIWRDELIRISLLLPIIRTEAARMEISPENVLLIDRMNKRYASVPVAELRELFHTEVDFPVLQSLFSNAIFPVSQGLDGFVPGNDVPPRRSQGDLATAPCRRFVYESGEFVYSFLTSLETNRLVSSSIEVRSSSSRLQWEYARFVPVGEVTFPSEMTVSVGKGNDRARTVFELSRIELGGGASPQSGRAASPPAGYEQIQLSELLKMLESL